MPIIQNLVVNMDIELTISCGMLHLYSKLKSLSAFITVFGCPTFQVTSASLLLVPFNDDLFVSVPSRLNLFILI